MISQPSKIQHSSLRDQLKALKSDLQGTSPEQSIKKSQSKPSKKQAPQPLKEKEVIPKELRSAKPTPKAIADTSKSSTPSQQGRVFRIKRV